MTNMMYKFAYRTLFALAACVGLGALPTAAHAQLVLSEAIVDLAPDKPARKDIEAWNNSNERSYIVVEPSEIIGAGTPGERRVQEADPEKLGLLVSPNRVILEPGERKLIRVAAISKRAATDRVYRVVVKPVSGDIAGKHTALKVLVGYDITGPRGGRRQGQRARPDRLNQPSSLLPDQDAVRTFPACRPRLRTSLIFSLRARKPTSSIAPQRTQVAARPLARRYLASASRQALAAT